MTFFKAPTTPGQSAEQGPLLNVRPGTGMFAVNPATSTGSQLSGADRVALTQRYFGDDLAGQEERRIQQSKRGYNFAQHVVGFAAGAAVNLVDDLWTNRLVSGAIEKTTLGAFDGADEDAVWELTKQFGSAGRWLENYYRDHEGALNVTSGIVGIVGTGYLAGAKLLPLLASRMAGSTAITSSRLWQAGVNHNIAVRTKVHEANLRAALTQQYASVWNSAAHRSLLYTQGARVAGIAAFEEAAIAVTMNANDLVYNPEDRAATAFWAAFGIGVGGGLGLLQGRAILRGMANDASVLQTRAMAQDVVGVTRKAEGRLPLELLGDAKAAPGASVTRYALDAIQADPKTSSHLAARTDAARTSAFDSAKQALLKMRFDEPTATHYVRTHLQNDPFTFHGLTRILPKDGLTALRAAETTLDDAMLVARTPPAQLQRASELVNNAMIHVDGHWFPAVRGTEMRSLVENPILRPGELKAVSKLTEEVEVRLANGRKFRIAQDKLTVKPAELGLRESLEVAASLRVFVDSTQTARNGVPGAFIVQAPERSNWLQYDAAIDALNRGKRVHFSEKAVQQGIATKESLLVASLRMKADEVLRDPALLSKAEDFVRLNLPIPTYMERGTAELGESTRLLLQAAKDGATHAELLTLRRKLQEIGGFVARDNKTLSLEGNLFNLNRDAKGNWIEPPVAVFSRQSADQQNRILDAVEDALVEHKMRIAHTLTTSRNDLVSNLSGMLLSNPAMAKASRVHGLADDTVTGLGGNLSQLAGQTRTAEFRYRDSETMLALTQVSELRTRQTDAYLTSLVDRHLAGAQERLVGTAAAPSRHLLNQFHTYSRGWDLLEEAVVLPQGGKTYYGFRLAPTERNAARLGVEQRALRDDVQLLTNPRTNAHVVLDDVGYDFQRRLNGLTSELLHGRNTIREALGLPPIAYRAWYTPPPSTRGRLVGFVMDANHNFIPNRAVIASTPEEYNRLRSALERQLESEMPGARVVTREQVAAYKDIFDDAAMDWIDPTILAAPAKGQTGGLGTEFLNPNGIQDIMNWIREQAESMGTAVQRAMLDDSIRSARLRHNVEISVGAAMPSGRTIYQEYEAMARGIPLSKLESSVLGPTAEAITQVGNRLLSAVWTSIPGVTASTAGRYLEEYGQRLGVPASKMPRIRNSTKSYRALAEALGPYSPYKNFDDYLTQTVGYNAPPEVRKITERINAFSSAILLRYVEVAQAAMNLLGLMTTMPAVVRAGKSHLFHLPLGQQGKPVAILDTMRILSGAVDDMVHRRSGVDWDYMVRNGDASQTIAELHKQVAQLTDRSGFQQVMFGVGSPAGKTGVRGLFKEKGIDGLLSVATDSTENWSRQYAHFVGLRLADLHGIQGLEGRHAFARDIANAGIANYSLVNRPELYQSPLGSLFGLFTSWQRAYNQRLFRWLEDGQYARVAEQYALQTAFFGATSVPGFDALSWLFDKSIGGRDDSGDEVPTLTDRIYAHLGPAAGFAFAQGGIAAVTGISLWTRGDTNLRAPSLNPIEHAPGLAMAQRMLSIGIDTYKYGADAELLAQSFGRHFPNRALRGAWTEIAMDGKEIDPTGRIVTQSETLLDSMARYAGVRSARSQQQVELYYANSAALRNDASRMEVLRLKTRNAIRSGELTDDKLFGLFEDYMRHGGNPAGFRVWVQSQMKESTSPRDVRQQQRLLNQEQNQLKIWRYDTYMQGLY